MSARTEAVGAGAIPARWSLRSPWTARAGAIVLAPVLLALALGWFRAGSVGRDLSLFYSVLFWLCMWLGYWAVAGVSTLALERAVPAARRHPWLLLVAGGTLASAASAFYLDPYMSFFDPLLSAEDRLRIAQFGALPASVRVPAAIESSCFGIVAWTVVNLFALRLGGATAAERAAPPTQTSSVPRAIVLPEAVANSGVIVTPTAVHVGEVPEPVRSFDAPSMPTGLAALLDGVPLEDVVAVQAQDHYILVHTSRGRRLVHHRFRDAVSDLAACEGAQVHRSWWVSAAAVSASKRVAGTSALRIGEALTVPIGRTHRDAFEQLRQRIRSAG